MWGKTWRKLHLLVPVKLFRVNIVLMWESSTRAFIWYLTRLDWVKKQHLMGVALRVQLPRDINAICSKQSNYIALILFPCESARQELSNDILLDKIRWQTWNGKMVRVVGEERMRIKGENQRMWRIRAPYHWPITAAFVPCPGATFLRSFEFECIQLLWLPDAEEFGYCENN